MYRAIILTLHCTLCTYLTLSLNSRLRAVAKEEKVKVLYNWKGSKDNQLVIKKGQIVRILSKTEKWWSGEVEGRVGWFPKTFVRVVEEEVDEAGGAADSQ